MKNFRVCLCFLLVVFSNYAFAIRDPEGKTKPNAAPRVSSPAIVAEKHARAEQLQASAQLQQDDKAATVSWDLQVGTPNIVRSKNLGRKSLSAANPAAKTIAQGTYAQRSLAVMDNLAPLYRIQDATSEFETLQKEETDQIGFRHQRMKQVYRGLGVVGGDVQVHFDAQSTAYQVDGRYVPDINVDVQPTITADQAIASAKGDLVTRGFDENLLRVSKAPELVVYALSEAPVLAYQLTLTKNVANTWKYWVDAQTGEIIRGLDEVCKIAPPTKTGGTAASLTGNLLSGEGGNSKTFSGWNQNSAYYMYNPTSYYYVYNNNSGTGDAPSTPKLNGVGPITNRTFPAVAPAAAVTYSDPSTYAYRTTTAWGTTDRTEVSIAVDMATVFDYYKSIHGRNGVDGAGTAVAAVAHYDASYVNAFWDSSTAAMYFGDGDNVDSAPLAVMDVCGHELTHGVTEHTANLNYQDESGALNESFSDVMGTTIEFYGQADDRTTYPGKTAGKADWLIGEDCWLSSTALRDMRNPANTATVGSGNQQPTKYKGTYWYTGTSDNGGVHQNSGVQNFFYYLLCDGGSGTNDGLTYKVTGIGIENARLVAYRALTVYCTSTTNYKGVRNAWISAATDLNSAWVSSVQAAWDAVGVAGPVPDTGVPVITSFTPTSGGTGNSVVLSGSNFTSTSSVKFNGVAASAFSVNSATIITATVPATATDGKISVTNSFGTTFSTANFKIVPILLSEDFTSITSGNNTTTSGSSTAWTGNANFPTIVSTYQAGGAVKLGTSKLVGSIKTKTLNLSVNGGSFDVTFDVKGWTTVEGNIAVSVTGMATQTVNYSKVITGSFENKSVHFTGGTTNSTITFATTAKRAFLDNIVVSYTAASQAITTSGTLAAVNTTYGSASPTPTSFTVGGTNMTAGILVTPPSGFEVSQSGGGTTGYSATQTIGSSGTIPATTVYLRLAASAPAASYSGNIVCSSSGATSVNLPVVNSVVAQKPLTLSAENRTKAFGSALTLGTTAFTSSGLVGSETIGSVALTASGGTSAYDAVSTYQITASNAAGGTFGAANYSITYQPGTLTVTAPTFSEWSAGLTDTSVTGDSDKDGVANLLEYFMGLDPTIADAAVPQIAIVGSEIHFDYRRSKALNGTSGSAEWTASLAGNVEWSTSGITDSLVTDQGAFELRRATLPVASGDTQKFLRLRVTTP